jgi:hypothetical protein
MARKREPSGTYAVCVRNEGYGASLELRKLYRVIADETAENRGLVRIIDESGEDYLYPRDWFIRVDLAAPVRRALAATARR